MKQGNFKALLPVGVFFLLYLGLGITLEYIWQIPMGFYKIPIVVVVLIALFVACLQNPECPFKQKINIMAKGIGEPNMVIMLLVFMLAGIFVGVVGRSSAESVAYFLLSIIPVRFAVVVLFLVSSFVAISMGTSVGTITLLTPVAVAVTKSIGLESALGIGAVISGAMFGDNLSFISDTTIAACSGQGCEMKDKFRENFKIAIPAAIVSVLIFFLKSENVAQGIEFSNSYTLVQIIPYIFVLFGGIIGINVFLVLLIGIICGTITMAVTEMSTPVTLLENMGSGVSGMFETAMVAIFVSAMCALINEYGGFKALLDFFQKKLEGKKSGKLGIGLLVGAMDIITANNTVAIVMANPIAKEMAENYEISPRKTASIMDVFSCVVQGILPYGAQMLVAISAAAELGCVVSPFQIMSNLIYPFVLFLSVVFFIWRE